MYLAAPQSGLFQRYPRFLQRLELVKSGPAALDRAMALIGRLVKPRKLPRQKQIKNRNVERVRLVVLPHYFAT